MPLCICLSILCTRAFNREIIKYANNKTFLDIGCGKGRPMIVAACYGFEEIVGIDFSKNFVKILQAQQPFTRKKILLSILVLLILMLLISNSGKCYHYLPFQSF